GARHELSRGDLLRLDHRQHGCEVRGLHAERTDDLELLEDDHVYRERDHALLRLRGETDLEMAPALAERQDRVEARGGNAERVDGDLGAASGERHDGSRGVVLRGIHGGLRAELLRERELVVGDVDGDDTGAEGRGDLDGGEPDAAAPVYGDPLTCPHL